MINYAKVTNKGQVTIPKLIRQKMNLTDNVRVKFILHEGTIIMLPITGKLADLRSLLPKPKNTLSIEAINQLISSKPC